MFLAILLISLFIYAWGLFSEYQNSQYELQNIEDTAKFNEQFTNYDRDDVTGSEILSLTNKVIDYNTRESNAEGATGIDNYKPIELTIDLSTGDKTKLTKNNQNVLFTSDKYVQNATQNKFANIISKANTIQDRYGGSDAATKLAKAIDSIFLSQYQLTYNLNTWNKTEEESWAEARNKFNAYSIKYKVGNTAQLLGEKDNVYTYYEYMQFKSAIFKSNGVEYDTNTGRVIKMSFNYST